MSTFPALQPATRVYTPGICASTELAALSGKQTSVRHSNASVGHLLRMTFTRLSDSEASELISHYSLHGTFETFDLSSTTLIATNLTFPANYNWRYFSSPVLEQAFGVTDATVELQLLPPYLI